MKKIIACMFAVVMLSVPVMASEVDLSSMSTDELIALRASITEEINTRIADMSGPIGSGTYEVGIDIKAGTYLLSDVKSEDDWKFVVFLYENREKLLNNEEMSGRSDSCYIDDGGSATVVLRDGMVMSIQGSATIQEMQPTWAP